jgi:hypothetical protein
MEVQNQQLLASQEALAELSEQPLSGLHALTLKEILSDVEARLQRLQEVQQDLMERENEEEADEEWQQVLQDDLELDHEPLPREAIKNIEVSAQTLIALDWLIHDEDND